VPGPWTTCTSGSGRCSRFARYRLPAELDSPRASEAFETLPSSAVCTNSCTFSHLSTARLQFPAKRDFVSPNRPFSTGTGKLYSGVDLESAISGDMFTVARMALSAQRALDNDEARKTRGHLPSKSTVSREEALGWITIQGARALGLEDRIGSLSPGKQADMVLIRADSLNMLPLHDPVASVVMQTSLANVDTVLVAGEIRKRNGRLIFPSLDARLAELDESGRRIAGGLTRRLAAH